MRSLIVLLVLLAGCSTAPKPESALYLQNVKPHIENGVIMYHGTNKIEHNDTPGWCYYCDLEAEYGTH